MKVLVLGATGFIGSAILQRLLAEGHQLIGLGRHPEHASRKYPQAEWLKADLSHLTTADAWRPLIETQDVIVNAAGALQDGMADDLAATQQDAMLALYEASIDAGGQLIIQISARTGGAAADLPFLATKRRADQALAESGLAHVILRPAVVIGRNAHGGTALLRALAAMPVALPLVHAESPVETVALEDLAEAVAMAIDGRIPSGSDIDLASETIVTLRQLVAAHRSWLGLPPVRSVSLPAVVAKPVSLCADLAGRLGWRSPLRSTAMAVMSEGVLSNPNRTQLSGLTLQDANTTLARYPAGVQDLWFARLYLLKPLIIVTLALFWLLSGLIPLIDPARAAEGFLPLMAPAAALGLTLFTCLLDIALGLAVLVRPYAGKALIGMLIVSCVYLAGGTLLQPGLWLDPLGPLVKVLPSLLLTFSALAILDER